MALTIIKRIKRTVTQIVGIVSVDKDGDIVTDDSGNPAGNVIVANLAQQLQLYTPSRDVFLDFFYGTDAAAGTLTVSDPNQVTPLEMREMHPDSRTIVIINEDATSRDYAYTVYFSRSGTVADYYATAATAAAGAKAKEVVIPLPFSTYGYDQYVHLEITPTAGQSGDQLDFTAYLTGRGG